MDTVYVFESNVKYEWQCPNCEYWNVESEDMDEHKIVCMKCDKEFIPKYD